MATSGHAEANAQPTYSFPLLMPRDIFDTLREWGCPVSETDIRQCNAESIQALYDYFLRTTAPHLRKRVHKKPTPGMLASVSFPEGHMTAFTFRGPQIATGTLLRLCGVHDYTWDDFFEPQPRRLRRILSALINFARFKMEREEAFYEYLAGIDEVDAKIAEAKKRVKAKRQERNALMKKREEARPLEDEVSQQVAELETEINHLNHRQAELRHEITELQHASRRKRDEVSSKNYAVVEADQEIERLLQQIVNSPERFRKSHADAEQRLGEQQSKVSQAEERLYAMRDEVEVYERASAEWDKTLAVLQDAAESVKRCRTAKAEVTRVREKAAENHRILELVTADTKRLEYQNERMREMIERNQRELKERVENMNAKLNMLRDRAREMEKAREGVRQEITRIEMQIKEKDHVSQMEALQFHSDCEEAKQILEHVKLSMERLRSQYMSETEKEIDLETDSIHGSVSLSSPITTASLRQAPPMASSGPAPEGDDGNCYELSALTRPTADWEISRDHVYFGTNVGFDTKLNSLQLIERPSDGRHGGVLLLVSGNTVQLLTLIDFTSPPEPPQRTVYNSSITYYLHPHVHSRRPVFGLSGSGIGAVCVHPSGAFFAVGEKGAKPHILVYKYPSLSPFKILRRGTEQAFSCLSFSHDGELLASVGSAPDYLLTIWDWQSETTVLRCKAFGQDVAGVAFSSNDKGFLATSGVAHIRVWKMAATFTGLKLQGEIGKFGKTELSDVAAFCILPDKKVLSGSDRGALLLWEGPTIKCELRISEEELPHTGEITVVQLQVSTRRILTAGVDGKMKFWSLDEVDGADLPPDGHFALVSCQEQVDVGHAIQCVARIEGDTYMVQGLNGGLDRIVCGEQLIVEKDYIPNDSGVMTAVVCSPYEHLAASCGQDGAVRAWDYTIQRCVFLETFSSPASCITWVPTASSFRNVDLGASRQVAVGFNDGVVRVLLLDMPRRRIVRTNVLKPHKDRVNRLCFSLSGKFLATASSDHSFFLFKTQPSAQSTPSTPYPPEYLPLGFVHLSSAAMDVSWRPDDEALLATLEDGSLVEYDLPEATLNELVEQAEAETRGAIPRASLEIRLDSRCLGALESVRPMTTPELDALVKDNEGLGALSPDAEEAVKKRFTLESNAKVKVRAAAYVSNKSFLLGTSSPFQSKLLHASFDGSEVLHRYPSDALASIESICTSYSTNFLLVGLSNGKIHIRSTKLPHAFLSAEFHDATPDGILGTSDRVRAQRLRACMSFDDTYLLSCGVDGNLCVLRLEPDKIERAARRLHESHHVLLKEADIVADQAQDKQQTVLDQIKKKKESEESEVTYSSNDIPDLTSMPVFHRAKAYNSYIQSKLIPSVDSEDEERMPGVGKDEEMFKGVTRLLNHPSTNLSPEAPPADGNAVHLREAMDLKDASKAYTIEESRQKTDADARAEAVKNNQEQTKEAMKSLRAKFQEIVERDRQLPEESRVSSDEWLLDVEYKELLERQGEAAIEEVKKEFAYDQEKSDKLLSKMTEEFLDPVAVELINVHSLSSDVCVQTFRTMQMHPNLHRRLTELKFQGTNDTDTKEYSTPPSVLHILAHEEIPLPPSFPLQESERRLLTAARCASAHSPTRLKGNQREKESVHGFEARKQKRLERKSRLAQWVDQKPREDADDARDVVATAFAARNVGDYKLKTASDYVVPGHQRVNAAKKRKQLAFLEEALHNARLQFNAQVLKLRDVKIPLVYALKRDQERMGLLRQALGVQGKMVEYTIAKDEWPEQREDVTVEDIDQYTRTQQVSLPRDKLQAVEQEGVAAYIARWKKELVVSEEDDDEHVYEVLMEVLQDALCTKNPYMSDPVQLACEADPSLLVLRHLSLKAASDPLKNSVQDDSPEAAITTYRLEQELRELESRIGHRIRLYDAAVQSLRKTRGALDISLKQTELQLLTLRSELTLLEELEYQEDALTSKLEKAQNDKDTILFDLETVQEAMDGKKSELETWQTQEKSVQAEFIGLVSVNNGSTTSSMANMMHPAYTALQKIFKKRLKRVKKKVNEEEEEEDEEEEEEDGEEESDEDDSDEDESDEEGEEDICPPGCDPVLYDQVLALREKRQDADDMILELTKALDEHKKSGERLTTKLRQIDKELQATEVDIQRFQSEKQRRFNELQVVRALSCHQLRSLQYLDGWTLPDDASDCLLFSLSTFERLASRVKSLKSENQSLRQQFRDLHRQQRSLSKEKQAQQQEVARMEEKSNQLQRLKFGRLVDLSVLDAGSEMTSVEDLRKKVNTKESAASKEVNQRHGEQLDVKKSLLDATERNTQLLNRVAELSERKMALERMLDHAQSQTQESTGDENEESKKEVEVKERRKLVKLVKLQAREVEALRQEIGLLKGKDGKVYFLQQK